MKQVEEAGGDLVVVVNMVDNDRRGRNRSNLTLKILSMGGILMTMDFDAQMAN